MQAPNKVGVIDIAFNKGSSMADKRLVNIRPREHGLSCLQWRAFRSATAAAPVGHGAPASHRGFQAASMRRGATEWVDCAAVFSCRAEQSAQLQAADQMLIDDRRVTVVACLHLR